MLRMKILGAFLLVSGIAVASHAEQRVMPAAGQDEVSSPFLVAAVSNSYGKTEMAATWAYRGQNHMNMPQAAGNGNVRYLHHVEPELRLSKAEQ